MKRVCLVVLDSVGIGELPDAHLFGDTGSHTLGNVFEATKMSLPNLFKMGLGNIEDAKLVKEAEPTAAYGRCAEKTFAKDTTCGHWEMAGIIMDTPFKTFPDGFPDEIIGEYEKRIGRKILANTVASGTEIINEYGDEHVRTGFPIIYTSADSVFQVAAHEEVVPLSELYKFCEIAREMLVGDDCVGRVIARPFVGESGNFKRTEHRKDYAIAPTAKTVLNAIEENGKSTLGVGKIEDIFCRSGVTHINHTTNNIDGINATLAALKESEPVDSLIFTNLVDFDMLYGHRNDPVGYAKALEYFDLRLPEIIDALGEDDILIITADHGCDPTTPSTDHSREYIPVLLYGKNVLPKNLGTRESFTDIAATIATHLELKDFSIGKSML